MNETMTFRDILVKILAITGFLVTVAVLVWGGVAGIKKAPQVFSSLASTMESVSTYKPLHELTVTTEKDVVNASESFEISWTDVQQDGEFAFTYTCVEGVSLQVRSADGTLMPMKCSDTLTVPATVHGLYLSVESTKYRFAEVQLAVAFTGKDTSETFNNSTKITVVNASVPTDLTELSDILPKAPTVEMPTIEIPTDTVADVSVAEPENTNQNTSTEAVAAPQIQNTPVPKVSDLKMSILGSGKLVNGVFTYTSVYTSHQNNALRFDVKNIGGATSQAWTFALLLPSGEVYTSPVQKALNPGDHIEFTLGFYLDGYKLDSLVLVPTLYVGTDSNLVNNSDSIRVRIDQ